MSEHKQVIVMRTDLNMRKGKMIAQGAHASMKVLLDMGGKFPGPGEDTFFMFPLTEDIQPWIEGRFKKIVVGVDSEKELINLYAQAQVSGLPCSMIIDSGLTEFGGVPTRTCIAIGPASDDKIDAITGHLKLL